MVVMAVANDYGVNDGNFSNVAWFGGVSLGSQESKRRAAVLENGIEQYAETRGKLDVVASMAEPCSSEIWRSESIGKPNGLDNIYGRRRGVGLFEVSGNAGPIMSRLAYAPGQLPMPALVETYQITLRIIVPKLTSLAHEG